MGIPLAPPEKLSMFPLTSNTPIPTFTSTPYDEQLDSEETEEKEPIRIRGNLISEPDGSDRCGLIFGSIVRNSADLSNGKKLFTRDKTDDSPIEQKSGRSTGLPNLSNRHGSGDDDDDDDGDDDERESLSMDVN